MTRPPYQAQFEALNEADAWPADEPAAERPVERFRTTESYIHWARGFAILAGMIGIILTFFLLWALLPIRERDDAAALAGLATPPPDTSPVAVAPRAAAAATAAVGPEQPRLNATVRQFPFVRRGAGVNFAVLTNLRQGQRVEVDGRSPDRQWYRIVLPDTPSERGWVSQEFLEVTGDINAIPEVRE